MYQLIATVLLRPRSDFDISVLWVRIIYAQNNKTGKQKSKILG